MIIGQLYGAQVEIWFGYKWVFYINGALVLAMMILTFIFYPDDKS
jgi:hypothetical protein